MTPPEQIRRNWRIAFLVWLILLTVATHLPQDPPVENPTIESPDKLLHFVCFGFLAFLFMSTGWIRSTVLSWIILSIWTLLDEATQDFLPLHRPFSIGDLIAGELGVLAAYAWAGSLQKPSQLDLKSSIDTVLAQPRNWIYLACTGTVVVVATTVASWFLYRWLTGQQQSDLAFLTGVLVGTIAMMLLLLSLGQVPFSLVIRGKNMVLALIGTMFLPIMILLFLPNTMIDPWVLALFAGVLEAKIVWDVVS